MHFETLLNHSITRIQQRKKKRQRTNTKRKKKIGNNILVGYSLLDTRTKMENFKEQYTRTNNKRRQRIEIDVYVLAYMLVTLDTAQFEISLLNTFA